MESWSDKFLKTPSTAPGRNVKAVTLGKYLDDLKIQGLQMAKRKQEQKKQVAIDDALKPRPRGFTPCSVRTAQQIAQLVKITFAFIVLAVMCDFVNAIGVTSLGLNISTSVLWA